MGSRKNSSRRDLNPYYRDSALTSLIEAATGENEEFRPETPKAIEPAPINGEE